MRKIILKACAVLTIAGAATLMNAEFPTMAAVSTYAETGVIDTSRNGLIYNSATKEWDYYEDGVIAKKTLMAYCNGKFWYVKDGKLDKSFTGIYVYSGKRYYFVNGCLQNDGKAHFVTIGNTNYYIENGVWDEWAYGMKTVDGICKYVSYGETYSRNRPVFCENTWWYLENGTVREDFTGVELVDGAKLFFKNGKWSRTSGIYKASSEKYYYIKDGKVDTSVTGLKYYDGEWLYFREGEYDISYSGLAYCNNEWWYVYCGKLRKNYNGLYDFNGKVWEVSQGKVVKTPDLSVTTEVTPESIPSRMVLGPNISLKYDANTRIAVISGAGQYYDFYDYEKINSIIGIDYKTIPIRKLIVEPGIKGLPSMFFAGMKIEEVYLPSSVTEIGEACFKDCKKLVAINLDSVRKIDDEAFSGCDSLTEATYYAYKDYGYGVYSNCKNLKKVTFEEGIAAVPAGALSKDEGVASVVIPASVKKIGEMSFDNYYGQVTCLGVKHGLVYEGSTKSWVYYNNNEVCKEKTLVAYNGELWYVSNGTIDKKVVAELFPFNGRRYYIKDGKVDRSCNGLLDSTRDYYYTNGYVDTSVNRVVMYKDELYKIRNGKRDYTYEGAAMYNNEIYYFKNGVSTWYSGIYEYKGEKYQFKGGKVENYTGISKYLSTPNCNGYWFKNGKVDVDANGIRYDENTVQATGHYYKNGVIDSNYTGLVYDAGTWRYIYHGYGNNFYTGFVSLNGKEWYIKNTTLRKITGIVSVLGIKYYVKDGYLDTSMNGLRYVDGTWYYFDKGAVVKNYKGLAYANNAWWYVKDGMLDKTYSGNVNYNGKVYKVVNGKVV